MKCKHVIALLTVLIVISMTGAANGQTTEQRFDSLFAIASSGSVMFVDLVEPAKDSVAAMGVVVVPFLIDKFTTTSARERWSVIHILKRIGSPAVPLLNEALRNPNGLIVQRVCWALGDIGDSAAIGPLVAVRDHQRWQVRDQVSGALGKIGVADARATETVQAGLSDSIGQVRKAAAVACGKIGLGDATEALVSMLGDDFYGARFAAYDALRKLDTVRVVETVTEWIGTSGQLAGNVACDLMADLGSDRALELLVAQTDSPDESRRAHAAVALIRSDPEDLCGFHNILFEREFDRLSLLKMQSARRDASTSD
jgi:HEAT repeat protein